jgi:hypothetical protein
VSGWIVDDVASAVHAVGAIDRIDRHRCRAEFEQRFTADRMAADYVAIYEKALSGAGARSCDPGARCTA